jgi:alanyl-tRNA synthetase
MDTADGRRAAVLDRTAFYPTSGGQPYDTGTLGTVRVTDVVEREDGTIFHLVDVDLAPGPVHGQIDWARRFEHMQQHTGQHVLSAGFDRLCQARTESFHLGSAAATIDLAREVTPAEIDRVELEVNRVVWEDRPVTIRFADAEEAAKLPLRKEPVRGGRLRLIDIEGYDLSACGGTHVKSTGAIGMVAVTAWERFRGGTRVEFRCGIRALRGHAAWRDTVAASVRLLSVLPGELPAGIERLQTEGRELKRRVKDLQERLASHEAGALASRAEPFAGGHLVVAAIEGWDAAGLKAIASAVAERPSHAAILVSSPAPASIVVARAGGIPLDAAAILKQVTGRFGGKGGGRPEAAQGGGIDAPARDIVAFARTVVGLPPA